MTTEEKPAGQESIDDKSFDSLPADWQKEIKKLRSESAEKRVALKELDGKYKTDLQRLAELQSAEEKRTIEQGEFKKLYEESKPKLEALSEYEKKTKAYDEYFQRQLDAALEGADENVKELIASSSKPLPEKLEMANKLKATQSASTESQGAARPGGSHKPDGDIVRRYHDAKSSGDRARILTEMKLNYPKVFESVMKNG